jgi:type II secretory pathway pseudopilin PulG
MIGILSAIGLVSLNGAREKARDAKRMSDLDQISKALLLYAADHDEKYPQVDQLPLGNAQDKSLPINKVVASVHTTVYDSLMSTYLSAVPTAPTATDKGMSGDEFRCDVGSDYWYTADKAIGNPDSSKVYAIWTRLERSNCDYLFIINSNGFAGIYDDRPGSGGNRPFLSINCNPPIPGATDTTNVCGTPAEYNCSNPGVCD